MPLEEKPITRIHACRQPRTRHRLGSVSRAMQWRILGSARCPGYSVEYYSKPLRALGDAFCIEYVSFCILLEYYWGPLRALSVTL